MTQEEVDTVLRDIVPYWKGKTSHELYLNNAAKRYSQGNLWG